VTTMPPAQRELEQLLHAGNRRLRVTKWLVWLAISCHSIGMLAAVSTVVLAWLRTYPWWLAAALAVGLIALSEWVDHIIDQRMADEMVYSREIVEKTVAFLRDGMSQQSTATTEEG